MAIKLWVKLKYGYKMPSTRKTSRSNFVFVINGKVKF